MITRQRLNLAICNFARWIVWKNGTIISRFYQRPFGNREVWLGYDPAFTGDRAALVIVAPPKVEGGDYRVLHKQTFHGMDYETQASRIKQFL